MLIQKTLVTFIILSVITFLSCNPDCNTSSNGNISIDSAPAILAGRENQILLRSIPANFLRGRSVFIDNPIAGPPALLQVESEFQPMLDGLVVTIPEDLAMISTPNIYVDDPDCSSNVLVVDPLLVRSEEFFYTSDAFVVPPIPLVIVPAPAVTPPVAVTNAWITPYDRAYCLWFVPFKDAQGNEMKQLKVYDLEAKDHHPGSEASGSREFVVCGTEPVRTITHINPVSGVIDKEANFIEITIDRSHKGAGTETFTGMFVEPVSVPDSDEWRNGGGCAPNMVRRENFMLLTSTRTGQQILLIKAAGN